MRQQIYYDFKNGILHAWKKYLLLFAAMIFISAIEYVTAREYIKYGFYHTMPSFGNYMIKWFRGIPRIDPTELKRELNIPQEWVALQILFILMCVSYVHSDFRANGYRLFLSIGNKKTWWASKIVWVWFTAICYSCLLYIFIFITSMISGQMQFLPTTNLWMGNMSFKLQLPYMITVFILPVVTFAALGSIEILIEFIFSPIYAVIFTLGYVLMGIYWIHPLLISNNTMFLRNAYFVPHTSIHTGLQILICIGISVTSLIIGIFYLKKYEF